MIDKTKTYYIAGPMSGIPQFNVPAFDLMALRMRAAGYNVVSPAELDSPEQRALLLASVDGRTPYANAETWGDFLGRDVKLIADRVHAIVVLPGWDKSRGARLEVFVALLCGLPIYKDWASSGNEPGLFEIGRAAVTAAIARSFA